MNPGMRKKALIALGIMGLVAVQLWRAEHKRPMTASEVKEVEDAENMFPGPQ